MSSDGNGQPNLDQHKSVKDEWGCQSAQVAPPYTDWYGGKKAENILTLLPLLWWDGVVGHRLDGCDALVTGWLRVGCFGVRCGFVMIKIGRAHV